MLPNLLMGGLLGGGLFSMLGYLRGHIALFAMAGIVLGLVQGVQWRWRDQRTDSYRAEHDPPGPTLKPGSLPQTDEMPEVSRYGAPTSSTVGLLLLLALSVPFVLMGALTREPAWMWLVIWAAITIPAGCLLWTILYTYTEIGPAGILLHRPRRSQRIGWSELAEVGWVRHASADVIVLSTLDGQRIRTVGIAIGPTGRGRKRVLRMLDDIGQAWATHG